MIFKCDYYSLNDNYLKSLTKFPILIIVKQKLIFKNPTIMKKLFLAIVLSGLSLTVTQAQTATASAAQTLTPVTTDRVPAAVKNKFAADYPAIKAPRWGKKGDNYQAYFKENNKTGTAIYSPAGAIIYSSGQIDVSSLPKKATDYLAKNNNGQPVKNATQIKDAKGNMHYQVIAANGKNFSFDGLGNLDSPAPETTPKK
jgi:hypothetical protein